MNIGNIYKQVIGETESYFAPVRLQKNGKLAGALIEFRRGRAKLRAKSVSVEDVEYRLWHSPDIVPAAVALVVMDLQEV